MKVNKANQQKMDSFLIHNEVQSRQEILNDKEYSVFPVIMMTVGVHAGSGGPVLYTQQALSEFYQTWNGTPVTLGHPTLEGQPVSANHPEFYQTQVVGTVFNTEFVDNKLKAEIWVENSRMNILHPGLLTSLKNGMKLDVSTGLFDNGPKKTGIFNGEEYQAIAQSIRPDHLALLPGETGACSWADGCGVRANIKEEKGVKSVKRTKVKVTPEEFDTLHQNKAEDVAIFLNEASYDSIVDAVREKVYSMDVQGEKYCYLKSVMPDYAVYRVETRNNSGTSGLMKRSYQITNGVAEWTSDPVLVQEEVTYKEIRNNQTNQTNKMEESMKTMKECCPAKVDEFIKANAKFTDADKEMLLNLTEDGFARIIDISAPTIVEKEVIKEVKVNTTSSFDELLANADPKTRESIQYGQALVVKQRESFVQAIKANKQNSFSDEELSGFDLGMLEKLARLTPTTNYAGNGGAPRTLVNAAPEVEPLPELDGWEEKK